MLLSGFDQDSPLNSYEESGLDSEEEATLFLRAHTGEFNTKEENEEEEEEELKEEKPKTTSYTPFHSSQTNQDLFGEIEEIESEDDENSSRSSNSNLKQLQRAPSLRCIICGSPFHRVCTVSIYFSPLKISFHAFIYSRVSGVIFVEEIIINGIVLFSPRVIFVTNLDTPHV